MTGRIELGNARQENGIRVLRRALVALALATALTACPEDQAGPAAESGVVPGNGSNSITGETPIAPAEAVSVAEAQGSEKPLIATRIFSAIVGDGATNAVLSPLSLEIALAIMAEGAEGPVRQLIETALGHSLDEVAGFEGALASDRAKVLTANALWLPSDTTVVPAYKSKISGRYRGEIKTVNFSAPGAIDQINGWTARKTENLIARIVDTLSPQTSLVATNALYFKAAWLLPFDRDKTQNKRFTTADGRAIETPMMSASGRFSYAETDLNHMITLPYAEPAFTMLILLPKQQADRTPAKEEAIALGLKQRPLPAMTPRPVDIGLPRFIAEASEDLTPRLTAEGLSALFGNLEAFTGIADPPPVITSILQRCLVKIDETGTEAAAATAVIGIRSLSTGTVSFVVDRPFYFALHHKAVATALVTGYVADPVQ